jgi:hypothetical protein
MSDISLMSKSTWNLNALTKLERMRIYDALAQCSTRKEREEVLRRIFPYHIPMVAPMFSKLIKSVNDVFGKHRSCPPADYKHECYKELKPAMNDFQQFLKDKRIISSDSGEPVRFTLKRRSPVTMPTPTPTPTPTPVLATSTSPHPAPLQPLNSNYIWHIPDWKIKRFAEMISERNTAEQKRRFIQKYVHVTDEDGEPFIGLLNDIIADILYLSNYDDDLTTESKIKRIFDHLLHLKNTTYPEVIHIVYPFPVAYPKVHRRSGSIRAPPDLHHLGGQTRRKKCRNKMK